MSLDFGISLDPSAVLQRHSLQDSDDEEEERQIELIAIPFTPAARRSRVIFAFGTAASIFTNSYFTIHDAPTYQIRSDCITVYKEKSFPSCKKEKPVLSEVFDVHCTNESFSLCVHVSELKSIYCQSWCSLVGFLYFL